MKRRRETIEETQERMEKIIREGRGRLLPSGHPDIQKRIDEVRAKANARREQAAKMKAESTEGPGYNPDDDMEYEPVNHSCYGEMATVGADLGNNFLVIVTPDTNWADAYLKVCNHQRYTSSTKIIRLAFKKEEAYIHKGDGKQLWRLTNSDVKMITKFLKSKPKGKYAEIAPTYWGLAIYHWNNECGFLNDKDYDESFPEGCNPESALFKNPQFVPLNTPMPDYTKIVYKGE
jgi:hypothetical protein